MRTQLLATLRALIVVLLLSTLSGTAMAHSNPRPRPLKWRCFIAILFEASPVVGTPVSQSREPHKFWDKGNSLLFAAVAATSAADFVVTKSNLDKGGNELNPATRLFGRSTAGLAMNSRGRRPGVVGISYLFHKTGHHKLERAVSFVDIGASTAAVSYDLSHR